MHKVHFIDGSTRVMSADELADLDPALWHTQEPADRARFVVLERFVDRKPVYVVHDRETGDEWPFATAELADSDADVRNKGGN